MILDSSRRYRAFQTLNDGPQFPSEATQDFLMGLKLDPTVTLWPTWSAPSLSLAMPLESQDSNLMPAGPGITPSTPGGPGTPGTVAGGVSIWLVVIAVVIVVMLWN